MIDDARQEARRSVDSDSTDVQVNVESIEDRYSLRFGVRSGSGSDSGDVVVDDWGWDMTLKTRYTGFWSNRSLLPEIIRHGLIKRRETRVLWL